MLRSLSLALGLLMPLFCDASIARSQGCISNRQTSITTMNMVVGTGQSLSRGFASTPLIDRKPDHCSYALMFETGVSLGLIDTYPPATLDPTELNYFVPLSESTIEVANTNILDGETIGAGLTYALQPNYPIVFGAFGVSGVDYAALRRNSPPYSNLLTAVTSAKNIEGSVPVVVRAITVTHGESDEELGDSAASYEADLVQWQSDLNHDIQAITGQSQTVLMFLDQMATWGLYGHLTPHTAIGQLQVTIDHPDTHIMVTPKYFLTPYVGGGVHLSAHSEEILGEYYAKAYKAVIFRGKTWKPVSFSTTPSISGSQITATFNVPAGRLAFDTIHVTDPGDASGTCPLANCKGFEYTDDSSSPPTIRSVALSGRNRVLVNLSAAPTAPAGSRYLRYAFTSFNGYGQGNLRDTDRTVSRLRDGTRLYDWCVTFDSIF